MAEKRELDGSPAELPLAKRIKLARPALRSYKALLDKLNTLGLGFLELLLGEEDDDSKEFSKDDLAEIVKAWRRPHKVKLCFFVDAFVKDCLGARFGQNNISCVGGSFGPSNVLP